MLQRTPRAFQWAVAGLLYYGAAWLGLRMAVYPETASPVWPATGVAIAALTILGPRAWPAIAAAVFVAEYPAFGLDGAALLTVGNTLEAVIGAVILRRAGGADAFVRRGGIGMALVAALVAPLPSTLCAIMPLDAVTGDTPLRELATTWYLGDVLGAALVAPPLLLLMRPAGVARRSPAEWALFLAAAVAAAMLAFYPLVSGVSTEVRLGFLVMAPLVWAASRFGPPVTAWGSLGLTLAALAGLAAGPIPADRNVALLEVQALAGLMAIVGLYLAATVHERNHTIQLLAEASAQKTRFLNKAAHELRTPLTPMVLQLHSLRQRIQGDPATARAAEVLARNVDRVALLVDRLLQAASVDQEAERLRLAPTDLADVARAAASGAGDRVPIHVEASGSSSMDRAAMVRVVAELASNAVRHARTAVHVRAEKTLGGGCRIHVDDDGPGVAPSDRARIFDAFAGSSAGLREGPGLGLHIARALVEGHQGTLTVDQSPEGGARFTVTLPS